jgi:hypothetical protein
VPDPELVAGLHQLALQEGVRSLEEQTREVGQIRDRIVSLIALTATATAFLVGAALAGRTRGAGFYIPLGVGTALFVVLVALGWAILRPLDGWRSKVSPTVLVEDFSDGLAGYRALASFYDQAFDANETKLDQLRTRMQFATAVAGAMIVCWVVLVWFVAS